MIKRNQNGFTIVELLIVVVVVAILAAITVVAYNGVQGRAYDTVAKTDVAKFGRLTQMYNVSNGKWPGSHGGSTTISGIMADIETMGALKFSGIANYGSMNSTDPHAGLMLYYRDASSNVSYICIAVMPRSGTPQYFSTDKGIFQPAVSGTASNGYDFITNCSNTAYGSSPTYGRFQLESYI